MSLVSDIHGYLEAQGALSGKTIKKMTLPDNPDEAIAVYQYGGMKPWYTTSQIPGPAYERPSLQILTRSAKTNPAAAEALAYTIFNILSAVVNTTISGVLYVSITPRTSPFQADRDDSGRLIYGCNYDVIKEGSHA